MRTKLAILTVLLTVTACDDGQDPTTPERTAELAPSTDAEVTTDHALTAQRTVTPDTDVRELARTLQPRMTRARFLRFTTSAIHDPVVAEVFIERLADGNESPEVRAALVEALPRTGGDYADAVLSLYGDEPEASVRTAMVGALQRAPAVQAREGIALGLEDRDAHVRAEAARVAGARPEIVELEAALADHVDDRDAEVRAAAIRSLGLVGADDKLDAVSSRLRDDDATVRLEALRALRRLDPAGAAGKVSVLVDDDNEIVRKAAQKLQTK
jgi:HEAT repeat protein